MPKIFKKPKMSLPSMNSPKTLMGVTLQAQSYVAGLAYLILVVVILLPFEFPAYDEITGQEYVVKYDVSQRLIALLLMTIPIALSIYTINCMVAGSCVVWSWIVAVITVIWVLIFVVTAFMYTLRKQ